MYKWCRLQLVEHWSTERSTWLPVKTQQRLVIASFITFLIVIVISFGITINLISSPKIYSDPCELKMDQNYLFYDLLTVIYCSVDQNYLFYYLLTVIYDPKSQWLTYVCGSKLLLSIFKNIFVWIF